MGQHTAASHEVSSLGGHNTHTYFEVLLAGLTYEKGERRPRDDFEGIAATEFTS
jgi:hypothetical protein